jgi:hypothetical protein
MGVTWLEPSTHPELSEDLIREAEAHFGVEFPSALLDLLREQNGGYIEELLVPVQEAFQEVERYYLGDGFVSVGQFFGIDPAPMADGSIYCSARMTEEWELPAGLVLLDGDGHTWLGLDYRGAKRDPGVVYVIADGGLVVPLASSFEAFVRALVPYSSVFDEDGNRK